MSERRGVMAAVAQEIVQEMNQAPAGSWAMQFQAVRSWAEWQARLEDVDVLHVDVAPGGIDDSQLDDRNGVAYLVATDIGIRKRLTQDDQDQASGRILPQVLDQLALLSEQILEFWMVDRLDDYGQAVWQQTDWILPYSSRLLREHRQWTSVIRVVHEVSKPIGSA